MVVRGGAGFYYGPSPENVGSANLNSDGFSSQTIWNATCLTTNGNTTFTGSSLCASAPAGSPAPTFTGPYSFSNPFPAGVVPTFSTPPAGLANNLGNTLNTVLHSQNTPTAYNYNFGFEYELPHQVVVSAAYVGSRGLFLPFNSVDLNDLNLATIQKYGAALCVDPSNPACQMVPNTWAAIQPANNANFGLSTVPLWVALQQYPQFGNGSYGDGNGILLNGYTGGDSEYSSLQLKVQKRLTHHFTTLSSFTWGKLITDDSYPPLGFVGSHVGRPQDWNLQYEHSISPQDVKYQFTGSVSYDLPVGRGQAVSLDGISNAVLGGWTANAIVYLSSGIPIASPTVGANVSYFNQRADLTCNPAAGAPHTAAEWFSPNCFAVPASQFVPGTAPAYLDNVRTMGARELDLSIYKTFTIKEGKDLRFDVSSYNVTNRAQLGMPGGSSGVATLTQVSAGQPFAQITNTINSPRQFQFGARFSF